MALAEITTPTLGEYNGKPTLSIPSPTKGGKTITFGVARWRQVLKYVDSVKAFVDANPVKTTVPDYSAIAASLLAKGIAPSEVAAMVEAWKAAA